METHGMLFLTIFISLTMGQTKDDFQIMKEMVVDMNRRLSVSEEKLAKTEAELAATKNYMSEALAMTKADLVSKADELKREVAILKAPLFIHVCGSHDQPLTISHRPITYTSLPYSSTNTEGGGLDITTGVFTAPLGGSYTVYWNLVADVKSETNSEIFLQKNGESLRESRTFSKYSGPSGYVLDQGGRTLVLYLGAGDTLQLYSGNSNAFPLFHITFCVSLTTSDIV